MTTTNKKAPLRIETYADYDAMATYAETNRLTVGQQLQLQQFARKQPLECPHCGASVFVEGLANVRKVIHDVSGCGGKKLPLPEDPEHTYEELEVKAEAVGVPVGLDLKTGGITLVAPDGNSSATVPTLAAAIGVVSAVSAPGAVTNLVAAAEAIAESTFPNGISASPTEPDPYEELKRAYAAGAKIEGTVDGKTWRMVVPEWKLLPANYRVSKKTDRSILRRLGLIG